MNICDNGVIREMTEEEIEELEKSARHNPPVDDPATADEIVEILTGESE